MEPGPTTPSFTLRELDPQALMTEAQAADFLSLSMRTLQAWRVRGGGPMFIRVGRAVRYRRSDLVDWIEARKVASTSAEAPLP